ncbi:hypothetical protein Pflav_027960 [Phytohabitans flavus]|uniref:Uncharacterized protein n=1 Tax=Phytohabitans flavus TaxID=1076124 RepID=A0A6F8XRE5_9ACTN|nr:hypothetical protein [Phytohabitans flavus]BCB76386.1 hypothetical protein Pflav_027960 [Phytohabitans flavus]
MSAPSAPVKAFLRTERGTRIDCLFNPAELTITKSNTWNASENKGGNAPSCASRPASPARSRSA